MTGTLVSPRGKSVPNVRLAFARRLSSRKVHLEAASWPGEAQALCPTNTQGLGGQGVWVPGTTDNFYH